MERLKKIRERLKKATPGPWTACCRGRCPCGQVWSQSADVPVLDVIRGEWGDPGLPYGKIESKQSTANALFIAHAPDDIAFLLSLVETREAAIAEEIRRRIREIGTHTYGDHVNPKRVEDLKKGGRIALTDLLLEISERRKR